MRLIKYYFLCWFLLNSMSLLAMRTELLDVICNQIDEYHLAIDKSVCCTHLIGSWMAYYNSYYITPSQANAEMKKIEFYIPYGSNKEKLLTQLIEKHWYVNWLMQKMVEEKVKEFEAVKGSTIDALDCHIPTIGNELGDMIYNKASEQFCQGITGLLKEININDMDYVILDGHTSAVLELKISEDGKLLRSKDYKNNTFIWDIKTGKRINSIQEKEDLIKWINNSHDYYDSVIDVQDKYCAKVVNYRNMQGRVIGSPFKNTAVLLLKDNIQIPMELWENGSLILLLKKREQREHLCEKAFWNSYHDKDELVALRQSRSIKTLTGFLRDNFDIRFKQYLDNK